jgi:methylglutaconyl-CoA hydratase
VNLNLRVGAANPEAVRLESRESNMTESVVSAIDGSIGRIEFSSGKANALSSAMLRELAQQFGKLSSDAQVRVIVLSSSGDGAFCAGALIDELKSISDQQAAEQYFFGFGRLILAMRDSQKFIVGRIHGKAVGGGVGITAACDYAVGLSSSAFRLSELEVGIGPFVIGPIVERKIGLGAFSALSIDTSWRDAGWAVLHGLLCDVEDSVDALDKKIEQLASRLAAFSPAATAELKRVLWAGTEEWSKVLQERAGASARLWLARNQ